MNNGSILRFAFRAMAVVAFATAFFLVLPIGAKEREKDAEWPNGGALFTSHKVELNSASREELMSIPGIGPALAERVIDARPFHNLSDIVRVNGIGPSTLGRMLPLIRVEPPSGC